MLLNYLLFTVLWIVVEWIYFQTAKRYTIVDKPNARSSHHKVTIRGGGIIFPFAITGGILFGPSDHWILALLTILIAVVSFIDDIRHVDSKARLLLQSAAVAGMLYLFASEFSILLLLLLFIMITGIINAYNFMDGINGITVLYSLITLGSMYWVEYRFADSAPSNLFIALLSSLIVFGFLNVRKKALCFSGDVGSVSLAFVFCYLLLKMSVATQFGWWILFLGIYGIDTVCTIVCRVFRKEPLMQAHRSHFYQFLANEAGWTHIQVSILYAVVQLILNILVIYSYASGQNWVALASLFGFLIIYIIFRLRFEGLKRLFGSYNP